ncbi:hypothetical protein [Parabacteroides chongii]|uniref:hypothetical protein n=2 Tax=Parabacteroides chongii TaxID=2685834 RepID=UPI00240E564A|nr:hypothetical protein [Parabacteroides chongii]WFE84973.1 hypothetical protein P3L47_23120 [Parabacteroides chongii]
MKKVNFKELSVEIGIDEFQKQDFRKEIGNALHRASESIPMSDLARKIFYSEDAIEISDEDFKTMLALLRTAYKKFIVDAVARSGEESTDIKNKEE